MAHFTANQFINSAKWEVSNIDENGRGQTAIAGRLDYAFIHIIKFNICLLFD